MTLLEYVLKVDIDFAQHMSEERGDFSSAASYAAVEAFGYQTVKDDPKWSTIAELSIALGRVPEVYRISQFGIQAISETIIGNQPRKTPKLFNRALLLETNDNTEIPLFGDITDLGMYPKDGGYMLVGLDRRVANSIIVQSRWVPSWAKKNLIPMESGPAYWNLYYELDEWGRSAASFILTLALLKEANGSPFLLAQKKYKLGNKNDRNAHHTGFQIKTITSQERTTRGVLELTESRLSRLASDWNYTMINGDSESSK